MKLNNIKIPVKCDNGICTNLANYIVSKTGTPLDMQLKFCNECVKNLHTLFTAAAKQNPKKTKNNEK